jgi:hypothetical protein
VASVIRAVKIETSAEECWNALADFGALHRRLAPGFITDCRLVEPDVREVTFSTGAVAKERLVGIDKNAMRLAYTVIDSPMGSTHHNASAQVNPDGHTRCTFIWVTDVLPDDLAARTAALMDSGIQAIKQNLESSAAN